MSPTIVLIVIGLGIAVLIKKTPPWLRVLCLLSALSLIHFETYRSLLRQHKGDMNVGVGWPYGELASHLRTLAEEDQHGELKSVLIQMDEHSRDIFNTWLYGDKDAFRRFVDLITRTNNSANQAVEAIGAPGSPQPHR